MSGYSEQVIPIVVTLFGSLLTVDFLYSFITQRRDILVAIFVLVYGLFYNAKKYVAQSLYPVASGTTTRTDPRRASLITLCSLGMNITAIVATRLFFDMFMSARGKTSLVWWQYIDLFSIGLTFLSAFLVNK